MPLVGRSGFGPRCWRCNRAFGCCFRLDVRRDGKCFRSPSVRFCPPTDSRAASLSVTLSKLTTTRHCDSDCSTRALCDDRFYLLSDEFEGEMRVCRCDFAV
ncbi:hypothetical protein HPB47_020064 [Ixodes persulcatus]|uniref:Uncharacterized protein n=1 Tax=Ixodes persulcatus TaxID=34615 RepID=A0AC60QGJ5_IXOPE|nr:hypothetical protein HPB47_020064 [Ixodes persulcatus]